MPSSTARKTLKSQFVDVNELWRSSSDEKSKKLAAAAANNEDIRNSSNNDRNNCPTPVKKPVPPPPPRKCSNQLTYLSSGLVVSLSRRDLISALVSCGCDHIAIEVFNYLDSASLLACSLVCVDWQRLLLEAIYTKNKFRSRIRHAIFSGISKQSRIEFTLASKHASIIDVTLDDDFNLFALVNDKDKDKRSHVMSCNLFGLGKKRVISAVDAANEAESGAASLCCISAGRGLVAVGARNGKIILLESERFGKKRLKPKTVLKHHTKAIRQILFPTESNSHIVTCSDDMSIGIITFSPSHSKTHCKLLHGHVSRVRAIDVQRGNVLSGSDDRSVKMWSLAGSNVDQRPLATLTGHSGPVTGVKLYLPLALSVAGSSVRLWDALQGTCLKLLQHEEGVSVTTMTWISTFEGAATVDASGRMRCFDLSADLESSREEASSEIIVASAVKSFASKSSKSSYKIESFPHHFSAVEFTNDLPLPTINVHCLDYV